MDPLGRGASLFHLSDSCVGQILNYFDNKGFLHGFANLHRLSRRSRRLADAAFCMRQAVDASGCTLLKDAAAARFARCTALQSVNFGGCDKLTYRLTDRAAEHLARCAALQSVDFAGCYELTDRGRGAPGALRLSAIRQLRGMLQADGQGRGAPGALRRIAIRGFCRLPQADGQGRGAPGALRLSAIRQLLIVAS
ncbi:unnamed protein product [Prorocentrum cordatum]|uniref:Uncharacterized protein n=1 Tax=Prorocentrum cordatum TaxID=2364126 RepID=A0ABN9U3V8_9DINO|nr:unnamed protein product [Polarella glacialis]